MPTKNPRLNVVLEKDVYALLRQLANKEGVSLSMKARDLIKESLELYEDRYLQEIATQRDASLRDEEALSHEDVWD